jgi:hypothetical protein
MQTIEYSTIVLIYIIHWYMLVLLRGKNLDYSQNIVITSAEKSQLRIDGTNKGSNKYVFELNAKVSIICNGLC